MVFKGCWWPPTRPRGSKGLELNHLEKCLGRGPPKRQSSSWASWHPLKVRDRRRWPGRFHPKEWTLGNGFGKHTKTLASGIIATKSRLFFVGTKNSYPEDSSQWFGNPEVTSQCRQPKNFLKSKGCQNLELSNMSTLNRLVDLHKKKGISWSTAWRRTVCRFLFAKPCWKPPSLIKKHRPKMQKIHLPNWWMH